MIASLTKTERKDLEKLIGDFEATAGALNDAMSAITAEWREAIDVRSDTWRASAAAAEAEERIDALDSIIEAIEGCIPVNLPE